MLSQQTQKYESRLTGRFTPNQKVDNETENDLMSLLVDVKLEESLKFNDKNIKKDLIKRAIETLNERKDNYTFKKV